MLDPNQGLQFPIHLKILHPDPQKNDCGSATLPQKAIFLLLNIFRELLWPRSSPYHLLWPERPLPPFLPHHALHPKGGLPAPPPAPPPLPSSPPFLGFFLQAQEAGGGQEAELRRRQRHSLAQFMEGPFFRSVLTRGSMVKVQFIHVCMYSRVQRFQQFNDPQVGVGVK